MGMRAVGIFIAILCLTASAEMLDRSGFNDELGVNPDTGVSQAEIDEFNRADEGFEESNPGIGDYLGYTVSAVTDFLSIFILLNPIQGGLTNVGFPGWFVSPIMNAIVRPLYYLSVIQMIRGVYFE